MNKKSQITIFVILAIVVLIIAGVTLYFVLKTKTPTQTTTPERSEVSNELKPLQQYIEGCIATIGHEGVISLGQHGGYIDPNDEYLSGRVFIKRPSLQYDSDVAYLSPDDPYSGVAYWYYSFSQGNCANCQMMSQTPYLDEMERQLSIYISENIDTCLNNFTTFTARGYNITTPSDMLVRTTIRDQDVVFEAVYPINVTFNNAKSSIEKYYTIDDVPLMKYYLMALNITTSEFDNGFLENLNTYLLYSYSGLDTAMLPPLFATTSDYSVYYWSQTAVKEHYKQLITSYMPVFRVLGTRNYQAIPTTNMSTYEKNFYDSMSLDFFHKNLDTTAISFIYPGSDIYLRIQPSRGDLIGPNQDMTPAVSLLPPQQYNTYKYFYDISYPIIVEIHDEYKKGQDYSFLFALESTTKENIKLRDWLNASNRPIYVAKGTFTREFTDPLVGANLSNANNSYTFKQRPRIDQNMFCSPDQQLSGRVSLRIFDASTTRAITDVSISYGCGSYMSCLVGTAQLNSTTHLTDFTTKLPLCMNGYLQLDKPGYLTKKIPLSTALNTAQNIGAVYLDPITTVNATINKFVFKRTIFKQQGLSYYLSVLNTTPVPIGENDTVIITLTRQKRATLDTDWEQTLAFGKNASTNPLSLQLVPGSYTITGQLLDQNGFVILKGCKPICYKSGFLGLGETCTSVPEKNIEISPAPWGGVEFDENNTVSFTRNDIAPGKTITFSVLRLANPLCIDNMQEIAALPQLTEQYRALLIPKIH